MSFNGNEGEVITLVTASAWTENYRNKMSLGDPLGHFFGKNNYTKILAQIGCVGIRNYHGIDDDGNKVLIMVGVDENEDDMVNGVIVEKALRCPTYCGRSNDLNS